MINNIANRNEGIAFPIITTALDHISNFLPSLTALKIPSGMDIKYISKVVHRPKEIETGSFSKTISITFLS